MRSSFGIRASCNSRRPKFLVVDLCLCYSYVPTVTAMSSQQKLVLSIIDFLNKSIEDGTVKQDDREGLEIASMLCKFNSFHSGEIP
jgi:hypothetical protein